jgi:hypothetical protein
MKRRTFAGGLLASGALPGLAIAQAPQPLAEPHFPTRLHQFVWRNWELANLDRMAEVVKATPPQLRVLGESMGLPPKPQLTSDQLRRIYISVIRQNWHLLPFEQLIALLGWTREKLEFTLKEDDFLDHKLGPKPECEAVAYRSPNDAERRRAAEMRRAVRSVLGAKLTAPGEPAFTFVHRLSSLEFERRRIPSARPGPEHVDLTGWRVEAGSGVEPRVAVRLTEYLRSSMLSTPGARGALALRISPTSEERFSADISDGRATLTGTSAGALMQAVYWAQDEMDSNGGPWLRRGSVERQIAWDPRHVYSYFALYGDPLLEAGIDPFPDGYLEKLARVGMNGVWMQCVLSNMAPSKQFPEFGARCDERIANLNKLIERAKRSGVKILLYVNEPRAQPSEFFRNRPELRGSESRGLYAMCTSQAPVREWISDSLAYLFERAPDLGGIFTITMSENFTNCHSRNNPKGCPRCSGRAHWDVVGEVIQTIRDGVRRSSKTAEIISWDWAWPPQMCRNLIPKLPTDTRFQSVSEWSTPIERGGIKTQIGEYSISVVGPGPRATENWKLAREAGVRTMAKTQFNNTWEISAVPYIPVPQLIARHCAGLARAGVSGLQASWTLGGYPSPNLEVAKEFYFSPAPSMDEILRKVAVRRYGPEVAAQAVEAWSRFSQAFELYPYSVAIYTIPTQHGPANLLRAKATGVRNSMILFPQDDYKSWSGKYPPGVVQREFSRMADLWEQALPGFRKAMQAVREAKRRQAEEDLSIAETCYLHFRSTANQVAFYILRDGPRTPEAVDRMRALVKAEMELARRLYPLARSHSVIAYEATNHYYYRPADLAEKILNCQWLLENELNG